MRRHDPYDASPASDPESSTYQQQFQRYYRQQQLLNSRVFHPVLDLALEAQLLHLQHQYGEQGPYTSPQLRLASALAELPITADAPSVPLTHLTRTVGCGPAAGVSTRCEFSWAEEVSHCSERDSMDHSDERHTTSESDGYAPASAPAGVGRAQVGGTRVECSSISKSTSSTCTSARATPQPERKPSSKQPVKPIQQEPKQRPPCSFEDLRPKPRSAQMKTSESAVSPAPNTKTEPPTYCTVVRTTAQQTAHIPGAIVPAPTASAAAIESNESSESRSTEKVKTEISKRLAASNVAGSEALTKNSKTAKKTGWTEVKGGAKATRSLTLTKPGPKAAPAANRDEVEAEAIVDDVIVAPTAPKTTQKKKKKKAGDNEEAEDFDAVLAQYAAVTSNAPKKAQRPHPRTSRAYALVSECLSRLNEISSPKLRFIRLQSARLAMVQDPSSCPADVCAKLTYELAECCSDLIDFENAREFAEESVSWAQKAQDASTEMKANLVLGKALVNQVRPDQAKAVLESVLASAERLQDTLHQGWALSHLGTVLELLGQFGDAFDCYQRAFQAAETQRNLRLQAEVGANIGVALLSLGDFEGAERRLTTALPQARATGDSQVLLRILNNLEYLYIVVDQLEKAKAAHHEEFEVSKAVGDVFGMAQSMQSLGITNRYSKSHEDSLRCFEKELTLVKEFCSQEPQNARGRLCECYGNLGSSLRWLGQHQRARAIHNKELLLAQSLDDAIHVAKAHTNIGDLEQSEGRPLEATRHYLETLRAVDRLPAEVKTSHLVKVTCTEMEWKALDGLESAFAELGQIDQALQAADRKHLPLLSEDIRRHLRRIGAEKGRHSGSPFLPLDAISGLCHVVGLSAIVVYSLTWDNTDRVSVYVLRPDAPMVRRQLVLTPQVMFTLASQSSAFRMQLVGSDFDTPLLPYLLASMSEKAVLQSEALPTALNEHLEVLSAALLRPLLDLLPTHRTTLPICFVPDGFLSNVPFHCLPVADLGTEEPEYLIQRAPVVAMPSLQALHMLAKLHGAGESVAPPPSTPSEVSRLVVASTGCEPVLSDRTFHSDGEVRIDVLEATEQMGEAESVGLARSRLLAGVSRAAAEALPLDFRLPYSFDVREDYSGTICGGQRSRRSQIQNGAQQPLWAELPHYHDALLTTHPLLQSEDVAALDMSRIPIIVHNGACGFTPRIIHETYVSVQRAMFGAGAPRQLSHLWGVNIVDHDLRLADQLVDEILHTSRNGKPFAQSYQDVLCAAILRGDDVHVWGRLCYGGLP